MQRVALFADSSAVLRAWRNHCAACSIRSASSARRRKPAGQAACAVISGAN